MAVSSGPMLGVDDADKREANVTQRPRSGYTREHWHQVGDSFDPKILDVVGVIPCAAKETIINCGQ